MLDLLIGKSSIAYSLIAQGQLFITSLKILDDLGHLDGSAVECLPSTQGVIPESRDRVPHQAPFMEPVSLSACVSASLVLCLS